MAENIRVLIEEEKVDKRIEELGKKISEEYAGKEVHLICILKGSIFFTCELAKNVIVIEDIIDSGRTLSYLLEILSARKPASLKLCTLLDKPDRRVMPVHVDYTGFEIPDEFVVGYGLDYDQRYRNLPYIGVLSFAE